MLSLEVRKASQWNISAMDRKHLNASMQQAGADHYNSKVLQNLSILH